MAYERERLHELIEGAMAQLKEARNLLAGDVGAYVVLNDIIQKAQHLNRKIQESP